MYVSLKFLIMDEVINVFFWNIIISNFNYIFLLIMLLVILKKYFFNFICYYTLNENWFVFYTLDLHILTNFNYVFFIK
jgi:hypothetical protein